MAALQEYTSPGWVVTETTWPFSTPIGVEIATRTLSAQVIVCDEIGDYEEAMALVSSHNCGVPLVASAHASGIEELLTRTGIRLLHEAKIFGAYVRIGRGENMNFTYDVCFWEDAERRKEGV